MNQIYSMNPVIISMLIQEDIRHNNGLISEGMTQQLPYLIKQLQNKYKLPEQKLEKLLNQISEIDPTEDKNYLTHVVKWIVNGSVRWPEDSNKVQQAILEYGKIKKNNPVTLKTIGKYDSLQDLMQDIDKVLRPDEVKQASRKEKIDQIVLPGSKVIYNDGKYAILEVANSDAAVKYSGGTKWCTSNRRTAQCYLKDGPLYVIYKDGRKYALLHVKSRQLMDISDKPANDIELGKVLNNVFDDVGIVFITKVRSKKHEQEIMKDPQYTCNYARDVIGGRWPEAEPYIMKDPEAALIYAIYVIKGRWLQAEPYIMKDPGYAHIYARDVIKGRWPEAEPYIMKDPEWACYYVKDVIKGRWPEAEPYIMKNPKWVYYYAIYVIGGRWPEAEPYIMKDPKWVYWYARDVIKGRWLEAEPYIMKNQEYAIRYSNDVIEAE